MKLEFPVTTNTIAGPVGTPFGNFILLLHRSASSPMQTLDKRNVGGCAYGENGRGDTHWIYVVSITPSDFLALRQLIHEWEPFPEDAVWLGKESWASIRTRFLSAFSIEKGANSYQSS